MTLTATHFAKWDGKGEGVACIDARGGSLLAQGCDFMEVEAKSPHIRLGKGLKSAVIMGNRFEGGGIRIANESSGDVQIAGNVKL